jgi:RNA polymerase sigma-70 factor (ECF subfamily)
MASDTDPRHQIPSPESLGPLFEEYRPRLGRMVAMRLDPRLLRRVEVCDVLQEAFLEVTRRLDEYRSSRSTPFFLWVRFLTGQKLLEIHRRHLETDRRDRNREVSPQFPAASSASMARALLDPGPTPSEVAVQAEEGQHLKEALDRLDEADREILVLRYFERLSNEEAAQVLGLTPSGAKQRLLQAMRRIKNVLGPLIRDWSNREEADGRS